MVLVVNGAACLQVPFAMLMIILFYYIAPCASVC